VSGGRSRPARSRPVWGWHPLRADWAARVVAGSPVAEGDLVLDLGAGTGALTWPLLDAGARVIAVELHPGRAASLAVRDVGDRLTVIERDLRELWLPARPFRVVASPPYALTARIVRLLMTTDRMRSADLVLQAGAALGLRERGLKGTHARRYRVALGLRVPRHAFTRPPRHDSIVVEIRHR
jgi:23S rRNA (adenine-N6)-dimethyltransferase